VRAGDERIVDAGDIGIAAVGIKRAPADAVNKHLGDAHVLARRQAQANPHAGEGEHGACAGRCRLAVLAAAGPCIRNRGKNAIVCQSVIFVAQDAGRVGLRHARAKLVARFIAQSGIVVARFIARVCNHVGFRLDDGKRGGRLDIVRR